MMNSMKGKRTCRKQVRRGTRFPNDLMVDSSTGPIGKLLHELHEHQIELEMQNRTLRQTQVALEESRDRYRDLYEFTPVGYLTLTPDGVIAEVNHTGAVLLGSECEILRKKRFMNFVVQDDRDRWIQHFIRVKKHVGSGKTELALQRGDGTIFYAQMDCACERIGADGKAILIALTDLGGREHTESTHRRDVMANELYAVSRRLSMMTRHFNAQEDAKRQMAGEMHDRISPNLAAIQINLAIVDKLLRPAAPEIAERLADIRALVEDTDASTHKIYSDLRSPVLDQNGLAATIKDGALHFEKRTGIQVRVHPGEAETRFPPAMEFMLFRIFQEALTNTLKHAQAKSIDVMLNQEASPAILAVVDDGVGFDPRRAGTGIGLINMREMTELAGCYLIVESQPGAGTRIEVRIQT